MDRNETIKIIRDALRRRSVRVWSVTGGRGTSWGWLNISAPPARRTPTGSMTPDDQAELARLLGMENVHHQGASIPASNDYYQEYVDRANGREPSKIGKPYWD